MRRPIFTRKWFAWNGVALALLTFAVLVRAFVWNGGWIFAVCAVLTLIFRFSAGELERRHDD